MDLDRIEKLKKRLYSRKPIENIDVRSPLFSVNKSGADYEGWAKDEKLQIPEVDDSGTGKFIKKLVIFSVGFFVVSLALASYIFFFKNKFVSSNNLDISVSGPSSVSAGSDILISVSVENKNQTDIESAVMTVSFPEGSVGLPDQTILKDKTEVLGVLPKGQTLTKDINFSILGNKDSVKSVMFKIQYRIKGSNAVFVKQKKYDLNLDSSPVILNVSSVKEISSGQNLTFKIDITSNAVTLLKDLYVKAEYPYGFEFQNSTLKNSTSNNEWFIGDLKNGDKKSFVVTGKLLAQNNEERTFRFSVGSKPNKDSDFDSVLSDTISSITIKKPFFNIVTNFGNMQDLSNFVVLENQNVYLNINLENTLNEKIYDGNVTVSLKSPYINESSVRVSQNGFYDSINNIVNWTRNTTEDLSVLNPLDNTSLSLQFDLVNIPTSVENPQIDLSITAKGLRSPESSDTEEIVSTVYRSIRLKTKTEVSSKVLYGGQISSTGPNPPESEKATTYNLDFSITNTYNDLSDAMLKAVLPEYVTFTGKFYPSSENIYYDEKTREVVWNIGSISNGAGFVNSAKKAGFQVKIIPSKNEISTMPKLTSSVNFSATDSFTSIPIKMNLGTLSIPSPILK
jgi:hypothetical protein